MTLGADRMRYLPAARPQHHPFPYFTTQDALLESDLCWLEGLFEQPGEWQHHQDSFYRADLRDVSDRLSHRPGLASGLVARMRALTGLPLLDRVQLTIQRMAPGQYALPHTDRPLLGYESVRLIVQLNRDWSPRDGGTLHLHPDPDGHHSTAQYPPQWNSAFGFVMTMQSFHSVRTVHAHRKTAVFHFWHPGNTPALAEWVARQLDGMRFDFSGALDQIAAQAECERPEEDSLRAGCVAYLLSRWGLPEDIILHGYQQALDPLCTPEGPLPVILARWVQHIWHQEFSIALWERLDAHCRPRGLSLHAEAIPAYVRTLRSEGGASAPCTPRATSPQTSGTSSG